MVQREKAKEMNRAKIRAAAENIIRTQGMEHLTMRRLAHDAGVSLRTPYNLFGSKTDVLFALLDGAKFDPFQRSPDQEKLSALEALLSTLDRVERTFEEDEEYFRTVYREIMVSDHPEARLAGVDNVLTIGQTFAAQALEAGELEEGTDASELGRHLGIQLTAILGMWASGFFSNAESIRQIKRGWTGVLLNHCTEKARPMIDAIYAATSKAREPAS